MSSNGTPAAFPASAAIADSLGSTGVMAPEVRAVWPGARIAGPAFTVRCYPHSIVTVHKALTMAPRGSVLVVDAGHDASGALFGGMMARDAIARGIQGLVTDGAVRDVSDLQALPFPAFARGITPRVGTNRRLGGVDEPISCGGCVVMPGDLVVGDADGVVVIPAAEVSSILEKAVQQEAREAGYEERMTAGDHLVDLLGGDLARTVYGSTT